jgi:hypothetical protein
MVEILLVAMLMMQIECPQTDTQGEIHLERLTFVSAFSLYTELRGRCIACRLICRLVVRI